MAQNKPKNADYSANNISALTPREHVRRRPGMYVGGTDKRALQHLIWTASDHMVEEATVGLCSYIYVHLLADNKVVVESDGITLLQGTGDASSISARIVELLSEFTYRENISKSYFGVQGSLHGMSLDIVNCLSADFRLEIQHEGLCWSQDYQQGIAITEVTDKKATGKDKTRIIFSPDFEVMDKNEFDFNAIVARFKDLSYLLPGIAFHIEDQRWGQTQAQFLSTNGLKDWVIENRQATPLHDIISGEASCEFVNQFGETYHAIAQFAFQFTHIESTNERSFINTVITPDGGTHIEGLQQAILEEISGNNLPQWQNINAGFSGIVHFLHPEPEFDGRTRFRIKNQDAYEVVKTALQSAIQNQAGAFEKVRELLLSRI